jgi:hypothetical protein
MIKLIRNITIFFIIGISSLILISQFINFPFKNSSNISEITKHVNQEHGNKFDLSKLQLNVEKIYNPVEKINFAGSSSSLFLLVSFIFLIILNFRNIFFSKPLFANNHFVSSFLIPPKFS